MLLDRYDEWLAARLEDLDYGDIDGIEAAVRRYPLQGTKKNEAEKELGYFLNNAPRMRYHWFRSRGLFVRSSVVEASCKAAASDSSSPACTGPPAAPTPSSPCAAKKPAAPGKPSATAPTLRHAQPDQASPEDDLDYLQI